MNRQERNALDRHITVNYGEDQFKSESAHFVIHISTIPHSMQRYNTAGDWEFPSDDDNRPVMNLNVKVSVTSDWRVAACVAVHELVEALLCKNNGINTEQVDKFDTEVGIALEDPGDHPEAPYQREHCIATAIERILVAEFGMKWADYEAALEELSHE